MRRRVVVTGMGMINPLGHDVETVWAALKDGRSGVSYTSIFDAQPVSNADFRRNKELGHCRRG